MQVENPWWTEPHRVASNVDVLKPRAYLSLFLRLVEQADVRRAVLLMGPRRVGKTVLIHHAIRDLLESGVPARQICYLSVDHPLYNGCMLEALLEYFTEAAGIDYRRERCYIFFDEIQYLRDWEVQLKILVDAATPSHFVASGSAAAALRMKSQESGVGRFTDFLLPPLTFSEYISLLGVPVPMHGEDENGWGIPVNIGELNAHFVKYLNFGGYPEVALSPAIQDDPARFIKSDIIDKVLLRDLPSLYGIQDIQELNHLFTTLAYNTAQEVSLDKLSKSSGVAKNTIKRYIEYLEAAFLLRIVHRVDRGGKRFQRANFFKVYLTNPSIRSALFSAVGPDDQDMGHLAETGIFAQWFHSPQQLHYARWDDGEVDIVCLENTTQIPDWAIEVKWSDLPLDDARLLENVIAFHHKSKLKRKVVVTTRTKSGTKTKDGVTIEFVPAAVYCYTVGDNILTSRLDHAAQAPVQAAPPQ